MKKIPPKFSYQDSLEFVESLVAKVGKGAVPVDTAAKALKFANRSSGLFPAKVGAAKQFDLLEYPSDGHIQVTQLYKDIQIGDNLNQSLIKSLKSPNFYDDMITRYEVEIGNDLDVSAISIFIENSNNVNERDARKIAQAFVDSMELYPQEGDEGVINDTDEEKNVGNIKTENNVTKSFPISFVEMPIGKSGIKILFPSEYMPDIISGKFQSGVAELIGNEANTEIALNLEKAKVPLNG